MKNKGIGAKVIIYQITLRINPEEGWVWKKKVPATIIESQDHHELYGHTCSGAYTYVRKEVYKNTPFKSYSIKLDDGLTDIEGNNEFIVREFDLKFIEDLLKNERIVSEKTYLSALRTIERYKEQQLKLKEIK